mmetsp:Transcript_10466/g.12058  ORF Transcript_10466/g.12058 Transcript_10466/m.12058 type:complete len:308 (-) Transcript_10466:375-1298(-)
MLRPLVPRSLTARLTFLSSPFTPIPAGRQTCRAGHQRLNSSISSLHSYKLKQFNSGLNFFVSSSPLTQAVSERGHLKSFSRGKKTKKKKKGSAKGNDLVEDDEPVVSKKSSKKTALEGNLDEGELVNMKAVKARMDTAISAFERKLASLRAGRADPGMLDNIKVNAYGSSQNLSDVAQSSLQSAKLIVVNVFDPSIVAEIDKAIRESGLNLNPSVDGSTIKVPIPKTTKESREETAKIARSARENTKRTVQSVRSDANKIIKSCKGEAGVSEDSIFAAQEMIDQEVEKVNAKILEMFQKREAEILEG